MVYNEDPYIRKDTAMLDNFIASFAVTGMVFGIGLLYNAILEYIDRKYRV